MQTCIIQESNPTSWKCYEIKFELPGTHITTLLNVPGAFVSKNCFRHKKLKMQWSEAWPTRNPYYDHIKRSGCLCFKEFFLHIKSWKCFEVKLELPGTQITTILNIPGAFVPNKCYTQKVVMPLENNVVNWASTTRNLHYNHIKRCRCLSCKHVSFKKVILLHENAMKWSLNYPEPILRPY